MTKAVTISRQAYGKIFLHAAKCFDGIVLGYVVGQVQGDKMTVSDVLSICHANPAGPILDIAGDTADKLFPDEKVIGIYFGTDGSTKGKTPVNIERIIEGVAGIVGGECLVLKIKNESLASKDKLFLEATTSRKTVCKCEVSDSMEFISSLLDALLIQKINIVYSDFEDHLSSSADSSSGKQVAAADFRNPIATNFIAHYTPTLNA